MDTRIKVIESVVFVPYTLESKLRKDLQKVEETLTQEMNTPTVRFVERGGQTVSESLSRNNPWSKENYCLRKCCPPCWGRKWLAQKKEKEAMTLVTGQGTPPTRKGKEGEKDSTALPICTRESVNYVLECISCKEKGIKRMYKARKLIQTWKCPGNYARKG